MPSPSFQVVNPTTGEESAPHPFITDTELEAVLSSACDIQREWASWAAPARAKILNDVARYHRDNLEEPATIAVREMGKPITQARAEVEFSADIYDYYADNGTAFLADEADRSLRQRLRADPQAADRHSARHHALELPLLPGGPFRRARTHGW